MDERQLRALQAQLALEQARPSVLGALTDPQFYKDIGSRLYGALEGGLKDVLPTGTRSPDLAALGAPVDPNYLQKMTDVGLAGMTVYHGSPHKFDKFDMSKVGTGEGAQSYGHGLYLAENPKVASGYQGAGMLHDKSVKIGDRWVQSRGTVGSGATVDDYMADALIRWDGDTKKAISWLSNNAGPYDLEAIKQIKSAYPKGGTAPLQDAGNLYKVDLPDEHIAKMLDWDKPLSQQHPDIISAIKTMSDNVKPFDKNAWDKLTGRDLYEKIAADRKTRGQGGYGVDQEAATKFLKDAGIPGIKYLDQGSRGITGIEPIKANIALAERQLRTWDAKGFAPGTPSQVATSQRAMYEKELAQLKQQLSEYESIKPTHNFVVFDDQLPKIIGRE